MNYLVKQISKYISYFFLPCTVLLAQFNYAEYNNTLKDYQSLHSLIKYYQRPFTCLFIGDKTASLAYEVAKKFNSICIIVAKDKCNEILNYCINNNLKNVMLLKKKLSYKECWTFSRCEHIDITISLSYKTKQKTSNALLSMGDYTYLGGLNNDEEKSIIKNHLQNISYQEYHEPTGRAYLCDTRGNNKSLKQNYWSRPNLFGSIIEESKNYSVQSSFYHKRFIKKNNNEVVSDTDWVHGINLDTFCHLNGVYPTRDTIVTNILELSSIRHSDIKLHNMVIQGAKIEFIDFPLSEIPLTPLAMTIALEKMVDLLDSYLGYSIKRFFRLIRNLKQD